MFIMSLILHERRQLYKKLFHPQKIFELKHSLKKEAVGLTVDLGD